MITSLIEMAELPKIYQNLPISGEKMLMSAELKGCFT